MRCQVESTVIQCDVDSVRSRERAARLTARRVLPHRASLSLFLPCSLDKPYFTIIGLGPLKLFTPNTMVTRALGEAYPRRAA